MRNSIVLIIQVFALSFISCSKDEFISSVCEADSEYTISEQFGRIYKAKNSESDFLYIGSPTPPPIGYSGGHIRSVELPLEFQKEGLQLVYSGMVNGAAFCNEECDPLFFHISITSIKKAE